MEIGRWHKIRRGNFKIKNKSCSGTSYQAAKPFEVDKMVNNSLNVLHNPNSEPTIQRQLL